MANNKEAFVCKENYSWYNGNINVTGQNVDITAQGVAFGNGYFIAVCKEAKIYRSSDGIEWEDISPPAYDSIQHFFDVDYDGEHNVWIVAGRNGMIIKSADDGDNWETTYTTGKTDDLLFAVFGNSTMLVISEGGQVFRSTDGGNDWTNYFWNPGSQRPRSITFARGVFAAGGYNGDIFYSSNGQSWTRVNSGSDMRVRGIAYSHGLDLWVAGGMSVCTAKNLDNWTYQFKIADEFNLPDQVYCAFGGKDFALLAGEHGMILTTTDPTGKSWVDRESGSGGYVFDITGHPNGKYAVNVGNTVYKRTPPTLWHYPFRYNKERCINPNMSPLFVTSGDSVVDEIKADYIPLDGKSDLRAEVHLRKDSKGRLWASIHYFGLYYSTDDGKTWTFKPNELVMKDPIAYSCFTILNDDTFLLGKVKDNWAPDVERTPILFYRSENYGDSWQLAGSIDAAPFEGISEGTQNLTQLADGTILYAATRYNWKPDPEEPDAVRENAIFRSTDGGFTWGDKSTTYSEGADKYVFEPHIIQLQSGKLLGAFRYQRHKLPGDTESAVTAAGGSWSCCTAGRNKSIFNQLYIGESYDNGYTWVNLHDIRDSNGNLLLFWGDPHGTLLQVPDGRILLVYDHRYESGPNCTQANAWKVCNRAVVSSDEGATWGPEIYHLSYGKGYPSSVFLEGNTIVTVTGNDLDNKKPFTAMAVRWKLPKAAQGGSIKVTSPSGDENLQPGSTHNITWQGTGTVGNVKIDYSPNGGASWTEVTPSASNTGLFKWTVPGKPSLKSLVRIREKGGTLSGVSNTVFAIGADLIPASIKVTSPNGGEKWETGSSHNITWTSSGKVEKVKIEYSANNGASWVQIVSSTPNTGVYKWTVPANPSGTCLVRVSETDGTPSDTGNAVFTIFSPAPGKSITVTAPNGGEKLEADSLFDIAWTSTGNVGNVGIYYSMDNGTSWAEIVAPAKNDGGHRWRVPKRLSGDCLLRIRELSSETSDVSDAVFSIVSPHDSKSIMVTSPGSGENWETGSLHNITWTSTGGIGNVRIDFSLDNGATWMEVVSSVPNTGVFEWPVPYIQSDRCRVRVTEASEFSDINDGAFSILEPSMSVAITSPNGGESWKRGKEKSITWEARGISGNVIITLWKDGERVGTIAEEVPSSPGVYRWTVGQHRDGTVEAGTGYTVRVKGTAPGERSYADSEGPFEIRG